MRSRPSPDRPALPNAPGRRPHAGAARAGLAVIHAQALYRPVPPVDCDDDGYPYRDSATVESDRHDILRSYLGDAMRARYADRAEVCVGCDMGVYFEKGNRAALVAPDLLVAFGVAGRARQSYKVWEEGKIPDLALEVLSESTWRKNVAVKPGLYRDLGVREFWTVDPLGKLSAPVVGLRLAADGVYEEIPPLPSGGWLSEVLGLELFMDAGEFRFRDPRTGAAVPSYGEQGADGQRKDATIQRLDATVQRLDATIQRRASALEAAQAEVAALTARLRRLEER